MSLKILNSLLMLNNKKHLIVHFKCILFCLQQQLTTIDCEFYIS